MGCGENYRTHLESNIEGIRKDLVRNWAETCKELCLETERDVRELPKRNLGII